MKKFIFMLVSLAMVVIMAGCGTTALVQQLQSNPDQDLLAAIRSVALIDSQAALDDANAHGDKIAAVCWASIHDYLVKNPPDQLLPSQNTGALLAIQKSRDAMNSINGGIPVDLKIGCAALVQDMRNRGLALAAMIAAASHGIPPVIP